MICGCSAEKWRPIVPDRSKRKAARDERPPLRSGNWKLETGNFSSVPVGLLRLVGGLQVLACFLLRALGVVVGLQRLAILVGGALALPGPAEDLAQLDVAPASGPPG